MKQTTTTTITILMIMGTLGVSAQSAETWILQRERVEANRYSNQVHSQARALADLDRQASRLADKAEAAYKAAIKREIAMSQVVRAEQAVNDKQVGIGGYQGTEYQLDTSRLEVAAKLHGEYK